MTKHLPFLMETYGVMPWHFGGPEHLTRKEVLAILEHYEAKRRAESKQSAGASRPSRTARRR